ncbi:hypothetical protein V7S43_012893 [Phytophthora oleae]|uniref:Ubiquitin-like protease family profile domain-containing protein n=1 Tax=Phytophthora oleae TaxID=2107226 RepID=A0ABD3F5G9_9STRA
MEDMALSAYSPTVFETSREEADKYAWTFVVPKALVTSMQAAIETFYANKAAAQSDQGPDEIDLANSQPDTELHAVVKLRTNLVFFSRRCVVAMKSLYEVTHLASAWRQDMKWLDQDWFDIQCVPVEFFAEETRATNLTAVDRKFRYDQMATEIAQKFELATAESKYSLRSKKAFIYFREIVGAVARTQWLTGSAVNYDVAAVCDGRDDCLVLSTYDLAGHFPKDRSHFSYKLVVVPINSHGVHWTVIMVAIKRGELEAHLYDPLPSPKHDKDLKTVLEDKVLPLLRAWDSHRRSYAEETYEFPAHIPENYIASPKQPDGGSCGIMALAMIHTFVREPNQGFKLDTVTNDYVAVLRLRFLWLVTCGSLIHATENQDDDDARATEAELKDAFKMKKKQ